MSQFILAGTNKLEWLITLQLAAFLTTRQHQNEVFGHNFLLVIRISIHLYHTPSAYLQQLQAILKCISLLSTCCTAAVTVLDCTPKPNQRWRIGQVLLDYGK